MIAQRIRAASLVAAAVALAAPAAAQQTDSNIFTTAPQTATGWYGSAAMQVMQYWMPSIGGFQSIVATPPPRFTGNFAFNPNADVTMAGGSVTVGFILPGGTLPTWVGRNARVQVTGMFALGNRETTDTRPVGSPPSVQIGFDGVNDNITDIKPLSSRFDNETRLAGGQIALVSDLPMGAWVITPSVRFFGSAQRQSFNLDATEGVGLFAIGYQDAYYERLQTARYGLGIGAGATRDLGSGWSVTFGASASAVYTTASYSGTFCFDGNPVAGGCDGLLGAGGASDSRSRLGAQLGGLLGINYAITPRAIISFNGSVDWFSAAAGTRHPNSTTAFAPFLGGDTSPASINWGGMTAAGAGVRLVIFN